MKQIANEHRNVMYAYHLLFLLSNSTKEICPTFLPAHKTNTLYKWHYYKQNQDALYMEAYVTPRNKPINS